MLEWGAAAIEQQWGHNVQGSSFHGSVVHSICIHINLSGFNLDANKGVKIENASAAFADGRGGQSGCSGRGLKQQADYADCLIQVGAEEGLLVYPSCTAG